jgi:two-component system chemotaxis response regulator CheY
MRVSTRKLIVDDSMILRMAAKKACVLAGVKPENIAEAGDGKQALAVLEKAQFDAVLLDLNMPVMDGEQFALAWSLQPKWRETRIFVVSTDSNKERRDRLRTMGVSGFLSKPFEPEALARLIKSDAMEKVS